MRDINSNTLSTKDYWDEVLKRAKLPRMNSDNNYSYKVSMDYIHDILKNNEGKSFLEIGCGSSGWLPYFQKRYKLIISGLDYSDIGCELARRNLEMQEIPYEEIYCKDFLAKDFTINKKFDFIFSYGVVEHFNDTTEIISIFKKLLAPGGKIITLVPNLNGFNGLVTKKFLTDIYLLHKVINNNELKSFHINNGLRIVKSDYVGTFSIAVFPFANSKSWLFRKDTKRRKLALTLQAKLDSFFSKVFKTFKLNMPSRAFSPYVICVAAIGSPE